MGYIYCITNLITNKKYVGKTTGSVTQRFKEHCRDCKKERCENRPLYIAMNKYGIENFLVEEILECANEELSSYEILYIEKFKTYGKTGYNATKGGDGTILFDYIEICTLYKELESIQAVATKLQCSTDTVSRVLKINGIPTVRHIQGCCSEPIMIKQYDLSGNFIKEWASIAEAAHWLVDNGYAKTYNGGVTQKIGMCRKGKLKTAYKFIWK